MLREIEIGVATENATVSDAARRLIDEANRRIDAFDHQRRGRLIENFVACDFAAAHAAMAWIVERRLAAGQRFCEWGSGFGVVTMLAALLDFDACGIDVEAELVEESRRLAEDLSISVEFAHGSAIPSGGRRLIRYVEDVAHIEIDSPPAYEQLGLDIADFDLFFAFPWPGEEDFWRTLFDRYAAHGSLLLTYHGLNDMQLVRKMG